MPQITRRYIDGPYGQLHLRAGGANLPEQNSLFCLHQSPKCGQEFQRFMTAAAYQRFLIAPDYPGYGMSDAPPSEEEASIQNYAKAMWAIADALDLQMLDLLGHHTGSKVALEMATQQPVRVGKIVLISAALLTDEERRDYETKFAPTPLDIEGTRFSQMWRRIIEVRGPGQTLELMAEAMQMNLMGGEKYEWGHTAAFKHCSPFEQALKTLPHPITLLNPGDSLHDITKRAEPLINNGQVIDRPEWGYGFMDIWTDEAAKLVLSYL